MAVNGIAKLMNFNEILAVHQSDVFKSHASYTWVKMGILLFAFLSCLLILF